LLLGGSAERPRAKERFEVLRTGAVLVIFRGGIWAHTHRCGFTCHQGAAKAPRGGGPWASGPWNWPQTRLASRGTPATETTAKPRPPQRHVGNIFPMTKTAPNSGLFEGGKSPLLFPSPQLPHQPPRPSPRTRNCCLPPLDRFGYNTTSCTRYNAGCTLHRAPTPNLRASHSK
jgi:hypothetical protein